MLSRRWGTARPRRTAWLAITAATASISACGGDEDGPTTPPRAAGSGGSPGHVHGLGVNPRDGALLVATHHGLFRANPEQRRARPYGRGRPDVMGFTVVGPDHVLGSGHPDPDDTSKPANLGLVASRDAGTTFTSRSLEGRADFHVLVARGERVYGYDVSRERLLVSTDQGRRWNERTAPGPVFSLAIDPANGERAVAATSAGLSVSSDAGRTWTLRRDAPAGMLAWPERESMYVVDANGQVLVSRDLGRSFRIIGSTEVQPVALEARGEELFAALVDGSILRSTDGGRTWRLRATL